MSAAGRVTVEFDAGMAGQRSLGSFEKTYGEADSKDNDNGRLFATWKNVDGNHIDALVEEFQDGDTILTIELYKEDEDG